VAKFRRNWKALALAALASGFVLGPAAAQEINVDKPAAADPAWGMCARAAAEVEKQFGLPAHILEAISLAETGWSGPDRRLATWPWTVHDGSKGYHLASREDAVKFVRNLRTDGQRSIDVGCMQVNLRHHPRAFTSVSEGFDPEANMRYAARFLIRIEQQTGNWPAAVARYHSYNPTFYEEYETKVMAFWQRAKAKAARSAGTTASVRAASNASAPVVRVSANESVRLGSDPSVKIIRGMRPAPDRSHSGMLVAAAVPDNAAEDVADNAPDGNDAAAGGDKPSNGVFGLRRIFSSRR
jgi:hypothetical protein